VNFEDSCNDFGAAAVTNRAHGRTLKPADGPARCNGNTLNVILHGMFAVQPMARTLRWSCRGWREYYAAGGFGVEGRCSLNGAEPLSTPDRAWLKPQGRGLRSHGHCGPRRAALRLMEPFCNITIPRRARYFVPACEQGKRRIFAGSSGVASSRIPYHGLCFSVHLRRRLAVAQQLSPRTRPAVARTICTFGPLLRSSGSCPPRGSEAFNNLFDQTLV
jgi:hypothetical protein